MADSLGTHTTNYRLKVRTALLMALAALCWAVLGTAGVLIGTYALGLALKDVSVAQRRVALVLVLVLSASASYAWEGWEGLLLDGGTFVASALLLELTLTRYVSSAWVSGVAAALAAVLLGSFLVWTQLVHSSVDAEIAAAVAGLQTVTPHYALEDVELLQGVSAYLRSMWPSGFALAAVVHVVFVQWALSLLANRYPAYAGTVRMTHYRAPLGVLALVLCGVLGMIASTMVGAYLPEAAPLAQMISANVFLSGRIGLALSGAAASLWYLKTAKGLSGTMAWFLVLLGFIGEVVFMMYWFIGLFDAWYDLRKHEPMKASGNRHM